MNCAYQDKHQTLKDKKLTECKMLVLENSIKFLKEIMQATPMLNAYTLNYLKVHNNKDHL